LDKVVQSFRKAGVQLWVNTPSEVNVVALPIKNAALLIASLLFIVLKLSSKYGQTRPIISM